MTPKDLNHIPKLPWLCVECGALLLSVGEHLREDAFDERQHQGTLVPFDRRKQSNA